MLKPFMRAVGFLAYFLITLEMIFMVTPFALYYYSAYSPFLSAASTVPSLSWLPAFFLPHLSTEVVPSIGGLIVLLGISGFLIGAVQVYYAKFRKRGVVRSGFYKRVRHPQYLFLGVAGLGLLIVWPRFILLIIYINVLWFYYFLARNEEERMRSRYGDAYLEPMLRAPMFIPGEPGGRLTHLLFGRIADRKLRLWVLYCASLAVSIGGAFALREVSLSATTHLKLPDQKIAGVSFLSGGETRLRELVQSAKSDREIQNRINQENSWTLVQALEGKASAAHVMIDAGMPVRQAKGLPLATKGIKLVLLRREDQGPQNQPFAAKARWQPFLIAELDDRNESRLIDLPAKLFVGNPVMPIF
jgi:protein-S-isoprenylcysteine O-methyltransferase Ste14